MVCFAFACLLACVKGHFASLFSSLFSLSTLPLVSIWSGKYSTDWVQCDGAFGGGRSQGCHGYLLPRASLLPGSTNLFRHELPSSSIVDEFNRHILELTLKAIILLCVNLSGSQLFCKYMYSDLFSLLHFL